MPIYGDISSQFFSMLQLGLQHRNFIRYGITHRNFFRCEISSQLFAVWALATIAQLCDVAYIAVFCGVSSGKFFTGNHRNFLRCDQEPGNLAQLCDMAGMISPRSSQKNAITFAISKISITFNPVNVYVLAGSPKF